MAGKQYFFLQALPLGRSKREQELEQAKARSHAAKVVHKRTKDAERGYQQLVKSVQGQHDGYHVPVQSAAGLIPSYLSLRQGNSDPFNAFAVPITSRTNALMVYTREIYLPSLWSDAANPGTVIRAVDWKDVISLLRDVGTASAHLARISAFMAQTGPRPSDRDPELGRQALIFNGKATSVLRERVQKGVIDFKTLHMMGCFLAVEVYGRNFTAARVHAKVLGQLFQSLDTPVDDQLLYSVIRHDAKLSMMSLTRPSLNVENWVPEVIERRFRLVIDGLPKEISLQAMEKGVETIDHGQLKHLIVTLRQILSLFLLGFSDPAYAGDEHTLFVRYVVQNTRCRLVNVYLDAEAAYRDPSNADFVIGLAQVQAYASLATLLWLRCITTGPNTSNRLLAFDGNEVRMSRLKETLSESEYMISEVSSHKYAGIRLWALYVGAYFEQREVLGTGIDCSASREWFNLRLARQAKAMGLGSWQLVRERLCGVLYTDAMKPHGSLWFEKTMEAITE